MQAAHSDDHPADTAGDRPAPEQSAVMKRLDNHALADAKLTQALALKIGQRRPVDAVNIGRLAEGKLIETQEQTFKTEKVLQRDSATDYQ